MGGFTDRLFININVALRHFFSYKLSRSLILGFFPFSSPSLLRHLYSIFYPLLFVFFFSVSFIRSASYRLDYKKEVAVGTISFDRPNDCCRQTPFFVVEYIHHCRDRLDGKNFPAMCIAHDVRGVRSILTESLPDTAIWRLHEAVWH